MLQLRYDVLRTIAKQLRDSGEDITLLHTKTRDRVQDLHSMWKGDAADKFFEEMELELLPPLNQTAKTLFAMQDVLLRVMKLVYEADQETAAYFRRGFDFSGGPTVGGIAGTVGGEFTGAGFIPGLGIHPNQPGAGNFGETAAGTAMDGGTEPGSDGTGGTGSDGSQFAGQQEAGSGQGSQPGAGTGGGGTGSGGGQGWSGSTGSNIGVGGIGSQMGSSSGVEQVINSPLKPDHVYGGGPSEGAAEGGGQQAGGTGGGESQQQGTGVAAGVTAGTAAAGAGVASLGKLGRVVRKGRKITRRIRSNS